MVNEVDYDHCIGKKSEVVSIAAFFEGDECGDESVYPESAEEAGDWYQKANRLWGGMPAFKNSDGKVYTTIMVHFLTEQDAAKFSNLIGQVITKKTKSVYFPKRENVCEIDKFWFDESEV